MEQDFIAYCNPNPMYADMCEIVVLMPKWCMAC
jgi:hypothetical protein